MKKIHLSILLVILSNLAFAQQPFNPFMKSSEEMAKETLNEYFQDWFVKTTVTSKRDSSKGKFNYNYEFTDSAIIIYQHATFGTSAVDATYSDKWFYIPLQDLYLKTDEADIETFHESTEISLTNKLNRIIAGNGTKYNLKDENTYLQTTITIPFLLQRKDNQNGIDNQNSILYRLNFFINLLRGEYPVENNTEKSIALKQEEPKPIIKKEYYDTGELQSETPTINGKIEGKQKYYYKSGKLGFYYEFKDNLRNGTYEHFFENGQLRQKNQYKNDEIVGEFKEYYENGTLKQESFFINGKRNGPQYKYGVDGKVISKEYYVMGKRSGTLDFCEGVDYLIKKMDDKTYADLDDIDWRYESFKRIKDFEFSSFYQTDPTTLTQFRLCSLKYLPEPTANETLFTQYENMVTQLKNCKEFKGKEAFTKVKETSKSTTLKYNNLVFVTIDFDPTNLAKGIELNIIRKE